MAVSPNATTTTSTSFNVDGIVSGLKTADIITKMMQLEKAPLLGLQKQQATTTARDAAYQAISAKMIAFQGTAQNLLLSTSINAKVAASSLPSVATATAGSTAINGAFSLNVINLATATSAASSGTLGTAADLTATTALASARLSLVATPGSITINGHVVTIATTDTWSDVQANISAATGGLVQLNLGSNSVSLTSATPVQLGSPTDTSNFLDATHLKGAAQTGSSGSYVTSSSQLLGAAIAANPLSTSGLSGIAASGAFSVNGVAIAWANTDSLNGILGRINSSAAGVTATYDPTNDKIALTNTNTGAQSISLMDTSGNFLAATHLDTALQAYGNAAQYKTTLNGVTSAPRYSNSNSVVGALPGVNLTLLSAGITNVTTTQDTTAATTNVGAFVTSFNAMVDLLDADTKYDPATKTAGPLAGDATITALARSLRSIVTQSAVVPAGSAYATMGDIGISTGAHGSAAGTTNHLVLDSAKLSAALMNNPQAVIQVLSGITGTTLSTPDATNPWIATVTGTPSGNVFAGQYKVSFNPSTLRLSSVFTPTNGSPGAAVSGTISPGGANTSLIPGVAILARNTLPSGAGTDTITYSVASRGIMQTLNAYLNTTMGAGGVFGVEHSQATASLQGLATQITAQNVLLAQRQTSLQAQFTAMEVALSKLQSQSAALASSLGTSSSSSGSSSSSSGG